MGHPVGFVILLAPLSSSLQDCGLKNSSASDRMPYVPYTPIVGESVTKDEAVEVSPFPIIFPENIPGDLRLVDIRHYTVGDGRHYFILVYATQAHGVFCIRAE